MALYSFISILPLRIFSLCGICSSIHLLHSYKRLYAFYTSHGPPQPLVFSFFQQYLHFYDCLFLFVYLFFHPFGQISHVGYTSSTLIPFLHSFLSFFLSGIIAPLRTLFVTMLLVLPSIFPNLSYIFSSLITVLHSLLLFCSFKQYLLLYDHSLSFCYLFFH